MTRTKNKPKTVQEAGPAAREAVLRQHQSARKSTAGPRPTPTPKPKKTKSGMVAFREIKRLQSSTNLLIPKAPFLRLVRETIQVVSGHTDYRITIEALEAMREASEAVIVNMFEDAYLLSLHAKRVTLMPRDITLLLRIRGDSHLQER